MSRQNGPAGWDQVVKAWRDTLFSVRDEAVLTNLSMRGP